MTRLRVPLWQLMLAVVLCGLGFAALNNPTQATAGWVFLATLGLLLLGFVGVAARRGRAQLGYLAFVLFGWGYLILILSTGVFRPLPPPTEGLLGDAFMAFHPPPPPQPNPHFSVTFTPITMPDKYGSFMQIGHSLTTLSFGFLGTILCLLFGTKPAETEQTASKGPTP